MKKITIYIILAVLLVSCNKPAKKEKTDSQFVCSVLVKTTPVKDQGESNICWIYAMLATIESEHLMIGDSVNLSPDYVTRMIMQEQAREYYMSQNEKKISMRGMAPMLIHYINTYGIMPFDSYFRTEKINYDVLARRLENTAGAQRSITDVNSNVTRTLDKAIGYLPHGIFMLGAEYTPLEFAHSVCSKNEYVALTSFTHHPFGKSFVLEVPDNALHDSFMNIPINQLMEQITTALLRGHAVCWEGDVTEPGFSFKDGVATVPGMRQCTQQQRQRDFETFRTTDDHCMELVGLAHDRNGNKYFIAKNSWGTENPYDGYMFLSENYVRLKTIAVMMPANLSSRASRE